VNGRAITFIDTPGHEAFTSLRARGARVTDIAVLVVAADDGVMPQTIEAINHAKAAKVPIIVAINKMDRPGADPAKIKNQLIEHTLVPEEFGGEVVTVPVSAKTGMGVDLLLENILLVADVQELKANPNRPAAGVVIEAHLDRARGPLATVLVQQGTLKVGDAIVAGDAWGRVKALLDHLGKRQQKATPAQAVEVLGLSTLPESGDQVTAFESDREARAHIEERKAKAGQGSQVARAPIFDEVFTADAATQMQELPIIVKADLQGTVEALRVSLDKLEAPTGTRLRLLHAAVGSITESDILLASASGALVLGFNTRLEPGAKVLAETNDVRIRTYDVIYALLDDVQKALKGILEPVTKEVIDGHADVRAVFPVSKRGKIAGCYVTDGLVNRNSRVRVLRGKEVTGAWPVSSLKRFKDDAREVTAGLECGIGVDGFNDFKEGDRLEFFHTETSR